MKFVIIFYLLGATLVSHAQQLSQTRHVNIQNDWKDAGIIAAVDMNVIKNAKNIHWEYMMKLLNKATVPNFEFHNGHLNSNRFYITEDTKQLKVESKENSSTILLHANDLEAGFTSTNFTYNLFFFSAVGRAEVRWSKVKLYAELDFTSEKLDGKETFAVNVNKVKLDIPAEHMDIIIHGNYFTNLAGAFKGLFISRLRSQMERHFEQIIKKDYPKLFNKDARASQSVTRVADDLLLDSYLSGKPEIQGDKLVFGFNGLQSINETLIRMQMGSWSSKQMPNSPSFYENTMQHYQFEAYILKTGSEKDNDQFVKLFTKSDSVIMFGIFRLNGIVVIEQNDYFIVRATQVETITLTWFPQTLPHMSGQWTFWLEHLNENGVHTRKMSKPLVYVFHKWLMQYYDSFGVIKMMDKFYTPYLYKIMGEKNPEEDG